MFYCKQTFTSNSDNWPNSCDRNNFKFRSAPVDHIISGNLNVVSNENIRPFIRKGPKYQILEKKYFDKCRLHICQICFVKETTLSPQGFSSSPT